MRRATSLIVVASAIALAACGGSDEPEEAFVPGPDESSATTVVLTVPPGTCQDVPDPASFPAGQLPPIIPPCEEPDELVVHTIRTGTGREATVGDQVFVDYTGMRVDDGAVFDTSYTRDAPQDFPLGRGDVIAGWDQGLVGARAGDMLRIDIPASLGYGDNPPAGSVIEPGDALSMIVEVRAVVAPVTADDAPLDILIEPSIGATEVSTDDLVVGDGATVEAGDTAVVHVLLVRGDNEVVLFNTWERSDPLRVVLEDGGSLPGIVEGLEGATVGSTRIIRMPPESAFGPEGNVSLGLPGGTDLIVVAEVVGVY